MQYQKLKVRVKKISGVVLLILATTVATNAQDYQKLKALFAVGIGATMLTIEPAYRVRDNLAIGLRFEEIDLSSSITSVTLNGQYYLSANKFRPFVGAGFGLYYRELGIETKSKLGIYPRVGFDLGHLSLSMDYNLVPATTFGSDEYKNSYLYLRIGFFVGGGRK